MPIKRLLAFPLLETVHSFAHPSIGRIEREFAGARWSADVGVQRYCLEMGD